MTPVDNELTTHLVTGGVVVYAIQMLKRANWCTWIDADTTTLNRWIGVLAAAVTALGIHWTFDASAGQLVITGLTKAGITDAVWEFAKQYVLQQMVYDGVTQNAGRREIQVQMPSSLPSSVPSSLPPPA